MVLDAQVDCDRHASPSAGTTSSAADWRPRTSPPSASAASSAASSRARAGRRPLRTPAAIAPAHALVGHHVRLRAEARARRVPGVGDAGLARVDRDRGRRPVRDRDLAHRAPAGSAATSRFSASLGVARRPRAPRATAARRPARRSTAWRPRRRPARAQVHDGADGEPVRLDGDAELARSRGSRATIEYVPRRMAREATPSDASRAPVLDRIRATRGLRALLRRRLAGRAALRRHGA